MSLNTIVVNGIPINVSAEVVLKLLSQNDCNAKVETPLMNDYAVFWFEKFKKPKLRPKTIISYRTMFNHILPFFKNRKIGDISTIDIQNFLEDHSNYSRSTVKHMKNVLHQIFDSAIEDGYITKNPTESNRIVISDKVTERKALTLEETRHILAQIDKLEVRDKTFLMLLMYTGERKGEVRGLRWEDIDFEHNIIHVKRAISSAENQPAIVPTKSKAGVRDIPLLPELKAYLEQVRCQSGFILGGNKPLTETQYRRMFKRIDKKINLHGATAHVFRHTFLTMAATNLDPKTLQSIAGHANCTTTMNRYVHKREDQIIESGKKLAGLFD